MGFMSPGKNTPEKKWKAKKARGAHSTAVRREWKQAGSYEETPMFEPLWRIDVEDGYRGAGDRRRANQRGTIPVEVLGPYVRSRIKKRCQFTGHRIVACNV
jgi:hypothetical protein